MKGRMILIQAAPRPTGSGDNSLHLGCAYLEDGRITDLQLDQREHDRGQTPVPGTIGIVQVDRVLANKTGAFAKTPGGTAFLTGRQPRAGGYLIAQVERFAEPGKAPPMTDRVLLKRRHVILTPDKPGVNVSRKIKGERLEAMAVSLSAAQEQVAADAPDCGAILRSEAWRVSPEQITAELSSCIAEWHHALARLKDDRAAKPCWLDGPDSVSSILEHWGTPADEIAIMIAGPNADEMVSDRNQLPQFADQHGLYRLHDGPDAFEDFGIWEEIERLKSPLVDLPSGGWIAVEATRAMVTVDVNTGDGFGPGDAMTANIEAARELPRQLRLRGLGGQIIIDFAPLKKMHRKKIEETLKAAFRRDPIETTLAGWTPLGNFELQRKRERRPLTDLL